MMAPDITGIVLAGGMSTRLGTDKSALRLIEGGPDLLTRTASLLAQITSRVLVIGRAHAEFACLPDEMPGSGPVGGVVTALRATGTACLVLSCDMPLMDKATLEKLIVFRSQRPPQTLLTTFQDAATGAIESLASIYEPQALACMESCLAHKRFKLTRSVPEMRQHRLPYAFDESLPFFNINYPADLRILQLYLQACNSKSL